MYLPSTSHISGFDPAGAASRKSNVVGSPVAGRKTRNPPPPMFPAVGCVTASANAVATAASTALPPSRMIWKPTSEAIALWLTTMPRLARIGAEPAWIVSDETRSATTRTNERRVMRRASEGELYASEQAGRPSLRSGAGARLREQGSRLAPGAGLAALRAQAGLLAPLGARARPSGLAFAHAGSRKRALRASEATRARARARAMGALLATRALLASASPIPISSSGRDRRARHGGREKHTPRAWRGPPRAAAR